MTSAARTLLRGSVRIPASKPHTQRALLMAALARGESTIRRPNACSEARLLQEAAVAFGASFTAQGDSLLVCGVDGRPRRPTSVLQVEGSGFALRHLTPVAALAEAPCVLTGDRRLATRPVQPLLAALAALGSRAEPADPALVLPLVTWTTGLRGGLVEVGASETSQFVSALMLAAPYADDAVSIRVPGVMVSQQYIRITRDLMRHFGARVRTSADLHAIDVRPGGYRGRSLLVGPDVTSLFYFIAAAVVADADILIEDAVLGVDAFLDRAAALGRRLGTRIEQKGTALRITSGPPPADQVVIDASGIPTLVPALAAVASSLPAGMLLRNARHIRHHKTSRLQVVLSELARMGRILRPHDRNGELDGFETERVEPGSADTVDSQGDHRNFMALYLATMALERPVQVLGMENLSTSFPEFLDCFRTLTTSPARA
jgi:3-phosphoshikimate 1-carboxyvinyltransferase